MSDVLNRIYQNNIDLLTAADVVWQSWDHEPILDYETDSRIAKELNWTAEPTKSLFLRLKDGRYCTFLTHKDTRLDSKAIRSLLGARPSICSNEEMQEQTGCVPGAVCPIGLSTEVTLVVDQALCDYPDIMLKFGISRCLFSNLPIEGKCKVNNLTLKHH